MSVIHKFLDAVEAWGEMRMVGLPLRMILTSYWHRIHMWLLAIGASFFVLGSQLDSAYLELIGYLLPLPSLVCFSLLIPVALSILFLEWISDYRRDES